MNTVVLFLIPVIFFVGFIGKDIIGGKELGFDKVMAGILLSVIVGMGIYIVQMKKQQKRN